MLTWPAVIVIAGCLGALGPVIDRLLLRRHKGRLHVWLLHVWNRLDDTRVPHLPRLMAGWTISAVDRVLRPAPPSWGALARLTAASSVLTIVGVFPPLALLIWPMESAPSYFEELPFIVMALVPLVLINLPFDVATVWISHRVLRVIRDHSSGLAMAGVIVDALAAFALAVASAAASIWILSDESPAIPLAVERVTRVLRVLVLGDPIVFDDDWEFTVGFLGCTTLIPTLLYMTFLVLLLAAKPVVEAGRRSVMYFAELATEDEPKKLIVFTLLTSTAAIVAIIGKAVNELISL